MSPGRTIATIALTPGVETIHGDFHVGHDRVDEGDHEKLFEENALTPWAGATEP
jgi:hypothetical protein